MTSPALVRTAAGSAQPLCATSSSEREEPVLATASRVDRWLLVEHRGSWGPASLPFERFAAETARALTLEAKQAGARLLMVRQPVRSSTPGRWVFAVRSRAGQERLLARHVEDDAELLDLQVPWEDEVPDGWEVCDERLWLVCTHVRHDLCCGTRGRPVAKALLAVEGEQVWESTHVGGDRFAANVIALPEGHYFGRVEAERAAELVASVRGGRLPVEVWRGRSSLPLPTQAAQAFARQQLGVDGIDDLALVRQTGDGRDRWKVELTGGVEVVVRYRRDGEPAFLTCGAAEKKPANGFSLVSLVAP